jgi:hypothetical protein
MKLLIFLVAICLSKSMHAQNNEVVAHLRPYNFYITTNIDTRIARLLLKPEIKLSLLEYGKLQINAHYGMQLAKIEEVDVKNIDLKRSLLSTGLDRKFSSYEGSVGYNFINIFNGSANIRTSKFPGVDRQVFLIEQGTRMSLFGARIGHGAYRGLVSGSDKNYQILDANKVSINGNPALSPYNDYLIKSHSITEYFFIGAQFIRSSKLDRQSDKLWGNRVSSFYVDFVYINKLYVAPIYSAFNEKFYFAPINGKKLTGPNLRLGRSYKGGGRAGVYYNMDANFFPSATNYSLEFMQINLDLGVHITPILNIIRGKE